MKLITLLTLLLCTTVHLTTAKSKHKKRTLQIRDEEQLGERLFKTKRSLENLELEDRPQTIRRHKRSLKSGHKDLAKTFTSADLLKHDEEQLAKEHFYVKRSIDDEEEEKEEEEEVEESRSKRSHVESLGDALNNLMKLTQETKQRRKDSGLQRETREAVDDPVTSQKKLANIQLASSALTGIEQELEANPDSIEERTNQIISTLHNIMAQSDDKDSQNKPNSNKGRKSKIQNLTDRDSNLAKQVMMLVTKLEVAKYVAQEHAKEELKKSQITYGYTGAQASPYTPPVQQYSPYLQQGYYPNSWYNQQAATYPQNMYSSPSVQYGSAIQGAAKANLFHPAAHPVPHPPPPVTPLHPPTPLTMSHGAAMYNPNNLSPFERASQQPNTYPVSDKMSNWQTFAMNRGPQYANYLESQVSSYPRFIASDYRTASGTPGHTNIFSGQGHVPIRVPSPLPRQAFYHSKKTPLPAKHTSASARHNSPHPEGYLNPRQYPYTPQVPQPMYTSNQASQSMYTNNPAPQASQSMYANNPYAASNMYSDYGGYGQQYANYNTGATNNYNNYYQPQQHSYYDPVIEKHRRKIESIKRAVAAVSNVENEIGLSSQTVFDLIDNVKKSALTHKNQFNQAVTEDEKQIKEKKAPKVKEKLVNDEKERDVAQTTLTEVQTIEKILTMIEAAKYYAEMKAESEVNPNGVDLQKLVAKRSVTAIDSDDELENDDQSSGSGSGSVSGSGSGDGVSITEDESDTGREKELVLSENDSVNDSVTESSDNKTSSKTELNQTEKDEEEKRSDLGSSNLGNEDKPIEVNRKSEVTQEVMDEQTKKSESLFASIIKSVITKGNEGLKMYEENLEKDISEAEKAKQNIYDSIGKGEFSKAEEEAELIKGKLEKDESRAFEEKKEIERAEKLARMVKGKHLTTEDVESLKKDIVPKLKKFMMKIYSKRN